MKQRIKQLLREQLNKVGSLLKEAADTVHLAQRVESRISAMTDNDLTPQEKNRILDNLSTVRGKDFPRDKSYGIMIGTFAPKPESELYVQVGGRGYYRIIEFGVDSTGNEIWIVVRNNEITTLMLRKSIQPTDKLFVDVVVKDPRTLSSVGAEKKKEPAMGARKLRWLQKQGKL